MRIKQINLITFIVLTLSLLTTVLIKLWVSNLPIRLILEILTIILTFALYHRFLQIKVKGLIEGLEKVLMGDYSHDFVSRSIGFWSPVADRLNQLLNQLRKLFKEMIQTSVEVAEANAVLSTEMVTSYENNLAIAKAFEEVAIGSEKQAAEVQSANNLVQFVFEFVINTSNMVTDLMEHQKEIVIDSEKSSQDVQQVVKEFEIVVKSVETSLEGITSLKNKSAQIGQVITAINRVANQTSLLAFNAAIEAARAGELGRGFGVVAQEIRNLAEETDRSTSQISEIVKSILTDVQDIYNQIQNSSEFIRNNQGQIGATGEMIIRLSKDIQHSQEDLKVVIEGINELSTKANQAIGNMDTIAAISEESAANSEEVAASINEQNQLLERVNLGTIQLKQRSLALQNLIVAAGMEQIMHGACERLLEFDKVGKLALEVLQKIKKESLVDDLYVTDLKGDFILSTHSGIIGMNIYQINEWAREMRDKGLKSISTPIHRRVEDQQLFKFHLLERERGGLVIVGMALESLMR